MRKKEDIYLHIDHHHLLSQCDENEYKKNLSILLHYGNFLFISDRKDKHKMERENNFNNCLSFSYLSPHIICYQFAHVYFIMFGDFKQQQKENVRGGGGRLRAIGKFIWVIFIPSIVLFLHFFFLIPQENKKKNWSKWIIY